MTLEQLLRDSIALRRWNIFLLGTFALATLALGAGRVDVARMIARQRMFVTLAGLAAGLVGAFSLTRLMSSLLYDVQPTDAQTFALVPSALAATACCMPALKGALVDPVVALRRE